MLSSIAHTVISALVLSTAFERKLRHRTSSHAILFLSKCFQILFTIRLKKKVTVLLWQLSPMAALIVLVC